MLIVGPAVVAALVSLLLAGASKISAVEQDSSFPGLIFIKTHKTASSAVAALFRANALLAWNQSVFAPEIGRGGQQWDFSDPRQVALVRYQGLTGAGSAPWKGCPCT